MGTCIHKHKQEIKSHPNETLATTLLIWRQRDYVAWLCNIQHYLMAMMLNWKQEHSQRSTVCWCWCSQPPPADPLPSLHWLGKLKWPKIWLWYWLMTTEWLYLHTSWLIVAILHCSAVGKQQHCVYKHRLECVSTKNVPHIIMFRYILQFLWGVCMNKYNEFPSFQIVMDDHYTTLIPNKVLFTEFSFPIYT